jgi:hypothetical protein
MLPVLWSRGMDAELVADLQTLLDQQQGSRTELTVTEQLRPHVWRLAVASSAQDAPDSVIARVGPERAEGPLRRGINATAAFVYALPVVGHAARSATSASEPTDRVSNLSDGKDKPEQCTYPEQDWQSREDIPLTLNAWPGNNRKRERDGQDDTDEHAEFTTFTQLVPDNRGEDRHERCQDE